MMMLSQMLKACKLDDFEGKTRVEDFIFEGVIFWTTPEHQLIKTFVNDWNVKSKIASNYALN